MLKEKLTNKTIWDIAYPIMLGNMAQTIITLTDTAFMGQIGEVALGASAFAAIYYYVFSTLAWGFALGVQVIIARRFGEQRYDRIGTVFNHGLLFVGVLGVVLFSLLKFLSPTILGMLISSPNVYETAQSFIQVRCFGIFFVCFNYLFRSLFVGLSNTKAISYSTAIMAVINILLDYVLVFGKFGFPEMGIEGAALASVIAEASAMIFFFIYTLRVLPIKEYTLFSFQKFEHKILGTTLSVAIPSMGQKLISFGTWLVFFSFVERMGERELASTMTMRSIYMLIGIPLFAYATTTNTLVSRFIGEGHPQLLMSVVKKVTQQAFLSMLPIVVVLILLPRSIISIYTDSPELIEMSVNSIYTLSFSAYCLALGMILFEAISGTSNTDHGMYIECFVLIAYIFTAWLTASYLKTTVEWVWMAEVTYGGCLALFSYIYLKCYDWKSRKRI